LRVSLRLREQYHREYKPNHSEAGRSKGHMPVAPLTGM
jgi:hypothetical protein